ncbi:hypothetical protein Desaci_1010 [Desulfosporosinus acidiphilus SJ4]|uniref:N-acetyltransferase domain-containing protein n=1 Tax=Desulfosporosinus acidiphilus (strain DSM 22704 / JCM 16185 / SJ4) TaxID=646529 RepID=I4D2M7_DESAJ|nr:hypothetical protein [Desulfosporosinus acidiphilus]AFM40051.1 hypothetical protein Desaci_1010 [Desulfosporosinus acidiphilus SJ4]
MSLKPRRIYTEEWSPSEEQINSIFPLDKITSEIGRNPDIKVFRDEEVKAKYPAQFNISVQARAYNLGLVELLHEYYETNKTKPELEDLLGVKLPQILWEDNLGYEDKLISLHITKLNKQEIFINDIVLVKNEDFDILSDEIIAQVLNNLQIFAKEQGARYLSGYAANRSTLAIFKGMGFQEDRRENMGNDYLWKIAVVTGEQLPFYTEL